MRALWSQPIQSIHSSSHQKRTRRSGHVSVLGDKYVPVPVYVTSVDVVRALQASDWLEADAGGFVWHDVDQAVLEFVAR